MSVITDEAGVTLLINSMQQQLEQLLQDRGIDNPAMVGIHTGGAWVANHLHQQMGIKQPLGSVDISFYRDDFTKKGLNPSVRASELPFTTNDQHIILVDDVVMSGRTIRAAMNEIFDYGRPSSIILATLVNLSGHELPIQADVIGKTMDLPPQQRLKLLGPEQLHLKQVAL